MKTWILSWLLLAATVIACTLFFVRPVGAQGSVDSSQSESVQDFSSVTPQLIQTNSWEVGETLLSPVFALAGQVRQTQQGVFSQDVVVLSGSTVLSGVVEQDVYVAGGTVIIEGEVRGNVIAAAGEISIQQGATVSGSLIAATQRLNISGVVQQDVQVWAQEVIISGTVLQQAKVEAQRLRLEDTAEIGSLAGTVQEFVASENVQVSSENLVISPRKLSESSTSWAIVLMRAVQGGVLVAGIWLLTLPLWKRAPNFLQQNLGAVAAWGFTVGLLFPIAILLLLATGLGVLLAFTASLIFIWILWLGWSVVAVTFALFLAEKYAQFPRIIIVSLVGAGWALLLMLPVVGLFVRVFSGLIGLGMICVWLWQSQKTEQKTKKAV